MILVVELVAAIFLLAVIAAMLMAVLVGLGRLLWAAIRGPREP